MTHPVCQNDYSTIQLETNKKFIEQNVKKSVTDSCTQRVKGVNFAYAVLISDGNSEIDARVCGVKLVTSSVKGIYFDRQQPVI